jgi:hypothetical protein
LLRQDRMGSPAGPRHHDRARDSSSRVQKEFGWALAAAMAHSPNVKALYDKRRLHIIFQRGTPKPETGDRHTWVRYQAGSGPGAVAIGKDMLHLPQVICSRVSPADGARFAAMPVLTNGDVGASPARLRRLVRRLADVAIVACSDYSVHVPNQVMRMSFSPDYIATTSDALDGAASLNAVVARARRDVLGATEVRAQVQDGLRAYKGPRSLYGHDFLAHHAIVVASVPVEGENADCGVAWPALFVPVPEVDAGAGTCTARLDVAALEHPKTRKTLTALEVMDDARAALEEVRSARQHVR